MMSRQLWSPEAEEAIEAGNGDAEATAEHMLRTFFISDTMSDDEVRMLREAFAVLLIKFAERVNTHE